MTNGGRREWMGKSQKRESRRRSQGIDGEEPGKGNRGRSKGIDAGGARKGKQKEDPWE